LIAILLRPLHKILTDTSSCHVLGHTDSSCLSPILFSPCEDHVNRTGAVNLRCGRILPAPRHRAKIEFNIPQITFMILSQRLAMMRSQYPKGEPEFLLLVLKRGPITSIQMQMRQHEASLVACFGKVKATVRSVLSEFSKSHSFCT
jgi:hypothetical protein